MATHTMYPCSHPFCGECLAGWLGKGKHECPTCRQGPAARGSARRGRCPPHSWLRPTRLPPPAAGLPSRAGRGEGCLPRRPACMVGGSSAAAAAFLQGRRDRGAGAGAPDGQHRHHGCPVGGCCLGGQQIYGRQGRGWAAGRAAGQAGRDVHGRGARAGPAPTSNDPWPHLAVAPRGPAVPPGEAAVLGGQPRAAGAGAGGALGRQQRQRARPRLRRRRRCAGWSVCSPHVHQRRPHPAHLDCGLALLHAALPATYGWISLLPF